jgi:hypothetical protein
MQFDATHNPGSNGAWEEVWTVEACGDVTTLKAKFTRSPQAGTDCHLSQ